MSPEDAVRKYNFLKLGDDGVLEMYCDHSMLSAIRQCESYFDLTYLQSKRHSERNWNFEFGIWLHTSLELFYFYEYKKLQRILRPTFDECSTLGCKHRRGQHHKGIGCMGKIWSDAQKKFIFCNCGGFKEWDYISKGSFLANAAQLWDRMEMDYFQDRHKNFKIIGGLVGALKLLADYYTVYGSGKERLRVIGIELPFGMGKEVPISDSNLDCKENTSLYSGNWYSGCYRTFLTGRIDLLIDDLISIMVEDHKSTAFFDGSEAVKFMPHDGMEGYAYAGNQLLKKIMPNKICNAVMINHVCLQDKDKDDKTKGKPAGYRDIIRQPEYRFTRSKITYTPEQFIEFRERQAATFDILYQLIILERPFQWNTNVCGNMYHKACPFKDLHSLTPKVREDILKNQYKTIEAWTPFYENRAEII